jgi:hypothetical protein
LKIYFGEGPNDCRFLKTIFEVKFDKTACPIHKDISKIKTVSSSQRYSKKFDCIIFSDGGKDLIPKFIPAFIRETLGKEKGSKSCLILKDDDGKGDANFLTQTYTEEIISILKSRNPTFNYIFNTEPENNLIVFLSPNDERNKIIFKFFFISNSLERNLVDLATKKFNFSGTRKKNILNLDPHVAIKEIGKIQNITPEELLKQAITEHWFTTEKWYNQLLLQLNGSNDI